MGFKDYMITGFFAMLFAFSLIYFITQISNDYRVPNTEVNAVTGGYNYDEMNTFLGGSYDSANGTRELFQGQDRSGTVDISIAGIFGAGVNMMNFVFAPITILQTVIVNQLHVPAIIVSSVIGLVTLLFLIALWALIRGYNV